MFPFYREEDQKLEAMLSAQSLCDGIDFEALSMRKDIPLQEVFVPDESYKFIHECAVIEYHGILFTSWYNNSKQELHGVTPIRGRYSKDGGKTWSDIETYAVDETGTILFCPPVYGICDDKLYMFINEMYIKPDHIHALDLFVFNEETFRFEKLWSRPIPFKLNTNVYALSNGKLALPGRIAELDGFPNTPAMLISDSGKIDAEWRLVYVAPNGDLPDGSAYEHPEVSLIVQKEELYMFCRNDHRRVPILYRSHDNGETWSRPIAIDIPFSNSKIYSGTLSNGVNYVIGNINPYQWGQVGYSHRERLAILFTEPNQMKFTRGFLLQNGWNEQLGYGRTQWSYPVAFEGKDALYVIYTGSLDNCPEIPALRSGILSAIPKSIWENK